MFIAWLSRFQSEAPKERNRCPAKAPVPGFAPNRARSLDERRIYKHLAPLERKRIQRLHFQLEYAIDNFDKDAASLLNCSNGSVCLRNFVRADNEPCRPWRSRQRRALAQRCQAGIRYCEQPSFEGLVHPGRGRTN
jgi:hypothetical protein